MNDLRQLFSRRYAAMKSFCQRAEQEHSLIEDWLKDRTDAEKYSAWNSQERLLAAALTDWQQSNEALLQALDEWL